MVISDDSKFYTLQIKVSRKTLYVKLTWFYVYQMRQVISKGSEAKWRKKYTAHTWTGSPTSSKKSSHTQPQPLSCLEL